MLGIKMVGRKLAAEVLLLVRTLHTRMGALELTIKSLQAQATSSEMRINHLNDLVRELSDELTRAEQARRYFSKDELEKPRTYVKVESDMKESNSPVWPAETREPTDG